jgi:hypothetical protein
MRPRICALAAALAMAASTTPARAIDPFEIQVYDGTSNAPRVFGLELHLNHWATGHASATAPELPLRGQTHFTLEPSYGLFPWWELGAYLQTAVRAGGHYDWAGVKLRSKFVTPPSFHPHLRLGLNVEGSYLPAAYERDQWGAELRPILAWDGAPWLVAFNPIVGFSFAGQGWKEGPTFEPAAKVARGIAEVFAVGVEYYASVGPIASPLPVAQQSHLFFGVLDVEAFKNVEVELGLGGGVTPASAGLIGKVILGYSFDLQKLRGKH